MPDIRCPRCGSEPTSAILPVSKDLPHWCSKPGCELPCWLWDDWEQLKRERDEARIQLKQIMDACDDSAVHAQLQRTRCT